MRRPRGQENRNRRSDIPLVAVTHLGGVEVQVLVQLVGGQVLVLMIVGGSHQHHPVAVVFTAGVQTRHKSISLENLPSHQ